MTFRLRIVPPETDPYEVTVDGENCTIGRSSNVELTIDDRAVSRRHARLFLDGRDLYLEDLQSNNGTWLEKLQVTNPVSIKVGQIIRLAAGQSNRGAAFEIHLLDAPGVDHEPQRLLERGIVKNALEVLEEASSLPPDNLDQDELRKYAERFHLLNGIHAALGGTVDESLLLELILERVFAHLTCDAGIIYLQNSQGRLEQAARRSSPGYSHKPLHSKTLIHQLMEEGKALLFNDVMRESIFDQAQSLHHARVRSLLASPLMDREGTLGMMVLYSRSSLGQFRMRDLELLVQLAAVATLRIRNLRLADLAAKQLMDINRVLQLEVEKRTRDLQDRNKELESLERIVYVLNREHELEKVLNTVLDKGFDLFPRAERGSFLLWRERNQTFSFAAVRGFEAQLDDIQLTLEEAMERYVVGLDEVCEGVYLTDDYPSLPHRERFAHLPQPRSMMAMTVVVDGDLLGFLILGSKKEMVLGPSDNDKLQRYRDHATAAVARARLLHRLSEEHKERIAAERKALVKERMAMLGQLSGGVAHCINNANNPVKQGTANLNDQLASFRRFLFGLMGEGEEEIKREFKDRLAGLEEQLMTVAGGSKRIEDFVKDLWLVFQVNEAAITEVDATAHLDATIKLLQGQFDMIEFRYNRPLSEVNLVCSPTELTRVFTAVINNACEAVIARREKEPEAPAWLGIDIEQTGDELMMIFRDTGIGIPTRLINQIFQPSFTTRPDIRSGMGLSVCHNIVENLGGCIQVDSIEDEGTTVIIRLPVNDHNRRPD
ncbi:MAG: GAF domain-containing protein [Acidobacteriota bacterium]|nr:GAF domain-containing protein [Acidobacteriota bacterium]